MTTQPELDLQTPLRRHDNKRGKRLETVVKQRELLTSNGYCETKDKKCNLYYEVYGNGTQKVIYTSGLGGGIDDFSGPMVHLLEKFDLQICLYENRCMKYSVGSKIRYKTSIFASDILDIMDKLGWEKAAVIGCSMGGMTAVEFGGTYPHRVNKLLVGCGTAGFTPTGFVVKTQAQCLFVRDQNKLIDLQSRIQFSDEFYDRIIPEYGITGREVIHLPLEETQMYEQPLPMTNMVSQMLACLTHKVPEEKLVALKNSGAKILVLHGTADRMIPYENGVALAEKIGGKLITFPGAGHGLQLEDQAKFYAALDELFEDN
ncbi:putative Alpha/Beta hydrolase protein [Blattamonas nauphoetae]|uniref:Alpha/Beta hydrolase protein n=1 Tax=Blattamonas nauphoetae TaxID=2049346 RepID=A0ABQ9Y2T8_9EUKA|nr:putative Alpha/Beta hydrolase protein [Blattamonas nauphoetae]